MKKVLAVILITVMIAALVPITSVATADPDTWFYDGDNSVFVGVMGYWVWPDQGFASELNVNFAAPNAFSGVKFMSTGDANVNVELYGMHGRIGGSVVHAIEGTGPVEVDFGTVNAPGNYTIKITYVSGAHFAVPIGHANPAMPVTCDVYPSNANENGITDPAPAMWLTGAEYSGPAADADQWLGDAAGLNFGYGMTTNPAGQYFDIVFDTPKAFGGFSAFFYVAGSVANIYLIDEAGTVLETIASYAFGAVDDVYTFYFSKAYAPGHYTIRIAMVSAAPHLLIGGTDNPGDLTSVVVTGAFVAAYGHPYPYVKLIGDYDPDETVRQSLYGGTASAGWWYHNIPADLEDPHITVTFTADLWFNRLMIVAYGGGKVDMELSTANGTVVDNATFSSPLGGTFNGFVTFTRNHAPGKYVLKITPNNIPRAVAGDPYFLLGTGSTETDNRVYVDSNVYEVARHIAPAITLMGAAEDQLDLKLTRINTSLVDGNLININFKADNALFADSDDGTTVVKFVMDDVETEVEGVVSGDQRVFTLAGVSPEQMDKTITATLKTSVGGIEKTAPVVSYTPQTYFETLINDPAQGAKVKALATATLDYGAAAQAYASETPTMTPADPTAYAAAIAERKATLTSVKTLDGTNVVNKLASWTAVGLKLEDEVSIRYTFKLLDTSVTSSAKIYFTYGTTEKTVDFSDLTPVGSDVYVYFLPMPANMLSESVTAVIKNGSDEISSRFTYSVESYAFAKKDDADQTLADLVAAMMVYGDAAKAYVDNPDD